MTSRPRLQEQNAKLAAETTLREIRTGAETLLVFDNPIRLRANTSILNALPVPCNTAAAAAAAIAIIIILIIITEVIAVIVKKQS